jgi:hypothetical protein
MLTVSSPTGGATLSSAGFDVSGTCNVNHQVKVRLTMSGTSQFHDYYALGAQGSWTTRVYPWGAGSYRATVTCEGMTDSIAVDLTVSSAGSPTSPMVGP